MYIDASSLLTGGFRNPRKPPCVRPWTGVKEMWNFPFFLRDGMKAEITVDSDTISETEVTNGLMQGCIYH